MTARRPDCSATGGSKRARGASPKPEDDASVLSAGLSKAARCSSSGFPAGFEAFARVWMMACGSFPAFAGRDGSVRLAMRLNMGRVAGKEKRELLCLVRATSI